MQNYLLHKNRALLKLFKKYSISNVWSTILHLCMIS